MEFVSHLQQVNRLFQKDDRIDLEHISLYNTLFTWWYHHSTGEKVAISHKKIMRDSGIKSKVIYDHVLKELDQFGYIMLFLPTEKEQSCFVRMVILPNENGMADSSPKKEERIYIGKFRLPGIEDLHKAVNNAPLKKVVNNDPKQDDLKAVLLKLVKEIYDRVVLMKVYLEKEIKEG
ncbi:hypothetical protein SAMN05518672_102441 [Chitinophaga sp. CF118]|uniref:hypothetical protein n=1 Tax=Chitinophaga sp. CF118 TaxID=1884367 RepID=UPI0008DF7D70|nr:hypothetical protein [Chitinophaga sp. CF118]SFD56599.1 hypothetical protein SAMN05518672_102441 [Chitinophaga sp. CF118]